MSLPSVLVLDDRCGWSAQLRQRMCDELYLKNLNEDEPRARGRTDLLAEAYFHPAQRIYERRVINDVQLALQEVARGWDGRPERRWALVLLDLQFNEGAFDGDVPDPRRPAAAPRRPNERFGLEILRALAERWPDRHNAQRTEVPVVVLSTRPRGELEAQLNNLGKLDYLEREDGAPETLRQRLADRLFQFGLFEDGPVLTIDQLGHIEIHPRSEHIVGKSLPVLKGLREARQAARTDSGCLILGPTGSGKERFARYLHELSDRRSGPFVPLNCANLGETTLEAELFGFAPNSGYVNSPSGGRAGSFELADTGTLFLDEIGDLPPPCQAKVLRAIQEKHVRRLGATADIHVDTRIIAATNRDLDAAVRDGTFRDDLFSRLKAFEIHLPGLDERSEDIPLLFDFFLEREAKKHRGAIWPKQIEPEAYVRLQRRAWWGNVRELEQLAGVIASKRKYSPVIVANDIPVPDGAQPDESAKELRDRLAQLEGEIELLRGKTSVVTLSTLPRAMSAIDIPDSLQLQGKLQELQDAYSALVVRLVAKTLVQLRATHGDDCVKPAMEFVLGRKLGGTSLAYSELLKLTKLSSRKKNWWADILPEPDRSLFDDVLGKAVANRRSNSSKGKTRNAK